MADLEPAIPSSAGQRYVTEIVRITGLSPEKMAELDACPRCGAFGGHQCFDMRFKGQPHLTPVPTKHRHRERGRRS